MSITKEELNAIYSAIKYKDWNNLAFKKVKDISFTELYNMKNSWNKQNYYWILVEKKYIDKDIVIAIELAVI